MVSDVLFQAVGGLRYHLKEPIFQKVYAGEMKKRIEALIVEMEALQVELDTPPQKK